MRGAWAADDPWQSYPQKFRGFFREAAWATLLPYVRSVCDGCAVTYHLRPIRCTKPYHNIPSRAYP